MPVTTTKVGVKDGEFAAQGFAVKQQQSRIPVTIITQCHARIEFIALWHLKMSGDYHVEWRPIFSVRKL